MLAAVDAFFLPAVPHPSVTTWTFGRGSERVEVRLPHLSWPLLERQLRALREAQAKVATRPVRALVAAIDAVAQRFLDPTDPLRQLAERVLPPVTGYSPPMIRATLDRMAADWRAERLEALLVAELGDPTLLDTFRPYAGGATHAVGPRLVVQIFSGNVPGVAVTALVRALLVKAASLGKTASGEPILPALFARALAEHDPELGAAVAVLHWPGGAEELENRVLQAADAVVVYGGDEAVAALRARTPPHIPFVAYGHRLSCAVVTREAAAEPAVVAAAARDVATFDQQGCVSPHVVYVEEGGAVSPAAWAAQLADALATLEVELPRGVLSPGETAAIRQIRAEAEFAQLAGTGVALYASPHSTAWTVIFEPDPSFVPSCLNRVVRVKPLARLEDLPELLRPVARWLQTIGYAGPRERFEPLAPRLARSGACRLAPLGFMAWPPPTWHHDGQPPLRVLLRWCDWEEP